MSGFLGIDFNHLAGGLEHGAVRGLQHIADAAREMLWAVKSGNPEALMGIEKVQVQFLTELCGAGTTILPSVVGALVMGGSVDPFAGSRKMQQDWENRFGKH